MLKPKLLYRCKGFCREIQLLSKWEYRYLFGKVRKPFSNSVEDHLLHLHKAFAETWLHSSIKQFQKSVISQTQTTGTYKYVNAIPKPSKHFCSVLYKGFLSVDFTIKDLIACVDMLCMCQVLFLIKGLY